jgi:hypothetical protein
MNPVIYCIKKVAYAYHVGAFFGWWKPLLIGMLVGMSLMWGILK